MTADAHASEPATSPPRSGSGARFGGLRRLMAGRSPLLLQRRETAWMRARVQPILDHFERTRVPASEYADSAADRPGLYAVWLPEAAWSELGLSPTPRLAGGWVYVGKAEKSINSRALNTHLGFAFGCTGRSSFRRTLVALPCEPFGFEVIPRNPLNPGHYNRYGLDSRDEWELGCWIHDRALIADWVWDRSRPLAEVEADVIATIAPPFNLTHTRTRWTDHIKAQRAACARLAREWALTRGLHPGGSPWSDPTGPNP